MTATRFTSLCEAIIEAAWLAILAVTPLFFNVYSTRIFEGEKVGLLRALALIMAAAWLAKVACGGPAFRPARPCDSRMAEPGDREGIRGRTSSRLLGVPLMAPVLLFVASQLLSSGFSIAPRLSWSGSFFRMQGTMTNLAYVVVFLLVLGHLRTAGQWRRVRLAVVVSGVAVSSYGLLQRLDLDPVPWGGQFGDRVTSTLGNPLFAAAYALFPTFFILEELASAAARSRGRSKAAGRRGAELRSALLVGGLALALVLNLSTFFLAGSRGPLVALVIGFGVLGVLWWLLPAGTVEGGGDPVVRKGGRKAWAWLLLALAATSGIAVVGARLGGSQGTAAVARLGTTLDPAVGSTRVRLLIWEGTMRLLAAHPARLPDGSADRFAPIRPLVGYGPETFVFAIGPFVPAGLVLLTGPEVVPDRAHNETFDTLVTTGGLGFVALLALAGATIAYALKWLGLIDSKRRLAKGGPASNPALLAALVAAVVAHLAEIHVGIAVTVTRVYFWFFLAAIVVVGKGWLATELRETPEEGGAVFSPAGRPEWSTALSYGLLTAVMLVAAIFGVYSAWQSQAFFDSTQPTAAAIATAHRVTSGRSGIPLLALLAWGCAGLLYLLEPRPEPVGKAGRGRLKNLDLFALASLGTLSFLGLWITSRLTLLALASRRGSDLKELVFRTAGLVTGVYSIVLVLVLLVAASLWWRSGDRRPWCARPWWWMAIAVAAIIPCCGWAIARTSVDGVTADTLLRQSVLHAQAKQFRESLALVSAAISLSPEEDQIRLTEGSLLLASCTVSPPKARDRLVERAIAAMTTGYRLSPLHPLHAVSVARTYLLASEMTDDRPASVERAREAVGYFTKALLLSPSLPHLNVELARACLRAGDPGRAETAFHHAIELDPEDPAAREGLAKLRGGGVPD